MNEILYHVVVEILEQSERQKSFSIWLFDKSLRFLLISLCETQEADWEKKINFGTYHWDFVSTKVLLHMLENLWYKIVNVWKYTI